MSKSYATTDDVIALKGSLDVDEIARLNTILPMCSAELRLLAKRQNKDLDEMIADDEDVLTIVQKLVIDASLNYYYQSENKEPVLTQFSQSAGGYSVSGTISNPGGAFFFPKKVLKDIGLASQKVGTIEVFDYEFNKRKNN